MCSANHGSRRRARRQRTPHPSSELSETANEAGHTDDSVRDGDPAGVNVEHGENKGGAGEREETAGVEQSDQQPRQIVK